MLSASGCADQSTLTRRRSRRSSDPHPVAEASESWRRKGAATIQETWFSVGGVFETKDVNSAIQRLMVRAGAAAQLINDSVDPSRWREDCGLDGILLVLTQAPLENPDISPLGVEDRFRSFKVSYDWLDEKFLDRVRGPWNVAAVLCLVLTTISEQEDMPLPRLKGPTS